MNQSNWSIVYADSEEIGGEDGSATNAINGQAVDYWHTEWSGSKPPHPHRLVIELGGEVRLSGFRYTPRQGADDLGGRIKKYRVYVGDHLVNSSAPKPVDN